MVSVPQAVWRLYLSVSIHIPDFFFSYTAMQLSACPADLLRTSGQGAVTDSQSVTATCTQMRKHLPRLPLGQKHTPGWKRARTWPLAQTHTPTHLYVQSSCINRAHTQKKRNPLSLSTDRLSSINLQTFSSLAVSDCVTNHTCI